VTSVLRPHQHSIGYTGDGFYRPKDPTVGDATRERKQRKQLNTHIHTQ